jgi:aryl-alcohol dehydrogenase-like predicted oxidoreductase
VLQDRLRVPVRRVPSFGVETRRFGNSELHVSVVGLGCNNFGRRIEADASTRVIHAALDAGITFFDTADIYAAGRSEEILGAALRGRRDSMVIATKFGGSMGDAAWRRGGSRRWIRVAVEESLRRLDTDWIDLYQMHFPDPATPIEKTLKALDGLVQQGKVRHVGSSNFASWQIAEADWLARTGGFNRFVSAQNEYNLLNRDVEREVVPACAHYDIGLIPYSPLADGLLTGKYQRGVAPPPGTRIGNNPERAQNVLTDRNFDVLEALQRLAGERGITLLDIAIGGLAAQAQVTSVIAGATTAEQVLANAKAGEWRPSRGELGEVDAITQPKVD